MKKNKKCGVCTYLDKYEDGFIEKVNNSLFCGYKYVDTLRILKSSKVVNDLTLPSKHLIVKHGDECLKDFKPIVRKKIVKTVDEDVVEIDEKPDVLTYTDYSKERKEDIPTILKDEMMSVACKLIDIANYRLNNFTGVGNSESVKDTVASLKIIIDLFNTGIKNDSDSYLESLTIEKLRETSEFIDYIKLKSSKL